MDKTTSTWPTAELCLHWAQLRWLGFKNEKGQTLIGYDKDGKHIWSDATR